MRRWLADGPLAGQYAPESRWVGGMIDDDDNKAVEYHERDRIHIYRRTRDVTLADPPADIYRHERTIETGE